jgi:hypothetical protein
MLNYPQIKNLDKNAKKFKTHKIVFWVIENNLLPIVANIHNL